MRDLEDVDFIIHRNQMLHSVLEYDRMQAKTLTVGERILINQERGSLCEHLSKWRDEPRNQPLRNLEVPEPLEEKVQKLWEKIKTDRWTNPENL